MVNTARSSMTCCRLSISASAATTRLPSATSRRINASTDSTIMRSARPPISATSRVSSCRSLSNALAVCSEAICLSSITIRLDRIMISFPCFKHDLFGKPVPTFPDHALAEPAGDVVLGASIARRREDLIGLVELDQLAEIHERGFVRDARGLLHIMGDDGDGVVLGQFLDQFIVLGGGNRIESRSPLVE